MDEPSNNSDKQWLHVEETIKMLCLAVCQIEASVADSGQSVDELTHSFTRLAEHSTHVHQQIQDLDDRDQIQEFKKNISETSNEMLAKIHQAVTAFQFYDRFSQRLDHVARSLENVSEVMSDEKVRNDPKAWQAIQASVMSSYSMDSERLMFEHILRGDSVREALEIYRHHFNQDQNGTTEDDDEIELF
jgi:hypothetical protein